MTAVPAILSTIIFFGSLILIFSEKLHRSITAIAGAALMVALGKILGFYSEESALDAIDFNTDQPARDATFVLTLPLEPNAFTTASVFSLSRVCPLDSENLYQSLVGNTKVGDSR